MRKIYWQEGQHFHSLPREAEESPLLGIFNKWDKQLSGKTTALRGFFKLFPTSSIFLSSRELQSKYTKQSAGGCVILVLQRAKVQKMLCLYTDGEFTREHNKYDPGRGKANEWESQLNMTLEFQFLGRQGTEDLAHTPLLAHWGQKNIT